MSLSDDILKIKAKILDLKRKGRAEELNEEETRRILIDPLIDALGYDTNDLDEVRHGWSGGRDTPDQKEADYALFAPGQEKPCIVVEAKRFRNSLGREKNKSQALMYSYLNGVPWCVLTNGSRIEVFDAFAKESGDRLIFSVEIETIDTNEGLPCKEIACLLSLLAPDSLKADKIRNYVRGKRVKMAVLETLRCMVEGQNKSLIRLLSKNLNREYSETQILNVLKDVKIEERISKETEPAIQGSGKEPNSCRSKKDAMLDRWKKLDTIVVSFREDSFNELFLGKKQSYGLIIRGARIGYIKYIAVYRTRPTCAITHYAEIRAIELSDRSEYKGHSWEGKYIVRYKGTPKEIKPVQINPVLGTLYMDLDDILAKT